MAIIIWPAELPQRMQREGFSRSMPDPRLQSRMATGPGKSRPRTSLAPAPVQGTIYLDHAGVARLDRFWLEETNKGSLPFRMIDQIYDGTPILTDESEAITTNGSLPILITAYWFVMFAEKPVVSSLGARFQASISVNVMP